MALARLEPPAQFNFRNHDDWQRWKRRFDQFRTASGLATDDVSKQTSILLYYLGEEVESVLNSMDVSDEEHRRLRHSHCKVSTASSK